MKRRKFIRTSLTATSGVAVSSVLANSSNRLPPQKQLYEWREYEMRFGSDGSQLENYFKSALIPGYNKYGVKNIGVFKEWSKSEPAKIYLLIPYTSIEDYSTINIKVKADTGFQENSAAYNRIPADKPVYNRYTTSLMIAFDGFPHLRIPDVSSSRIFELRTYEGYSEDALRRKIKMFNEGEFPIFSRSGLNSVFFGEVIAGDKMPRLTYLLTFNNMEKRDKAWGAFGSDPEWKKLSADPQYANSVSNIIKSFLVPAPYSQL